MKKNKRKNNFIFIILFRIISIIIILICLYRIYEWHLENKANHTIIDNILTQISFPDENLEISNGTNSNNIISNESITEFSKETLDFSNLINQNPDTVAWIKINGTEVNFPVVKTNNNDYYIKHNFNKEYNSAGWIFADYRNKFDSTDKNIIIYGHNRRDGSMFSSLNNVLSENWYTHENNQIITLYTPSETLKYQVFSVYKTHQSNFNNDTDFENDQIFENYLNLSKNNSIYDFNVNITPSDKILTIYTCANNNQYRIIVHAKQIEN